MSAAFQHIKMDFKNFYMVGTVAWPVEHPIGMLVRVLVALLPIQLPVVVPGKVEEEGPSS